MAKKKVTHKQADGAKPRNQTEGKTLTPTMEDPVEKFHNLKALNFIILKETFEKRQKLESLSMDNKALESDLSRCVLEKNAVVADLNLKENEISVLKSETNEQLRDLEGRLVEACLERDFAREDFDSQVKETNGLKEKLVVMEKQESDFKDEIFKLKSEYQGLVTERNRDIEDVKKEKDLLDSRLVEAVKENDDLKGVIAGLLREKNEIEMERTGLKLKIDGLEKEVEKSNELVSKYHNLKALNSILVNETFENRQKLESLSLDNKALESDLSRCVLEKNAVVADLNLKENEISVLKSERNEQLRDLEGRLVEACLERDFARDDFDSHVKETNGLKEKLVVMEKQESDFKDEIFKLKSEFQGLVTEKIRDIEDVKKEKDLLDSRLVEAVKENDDLNGVIACLLREKNEIEMERTGQKLKIDGLEKEVEKSNDLVSKYQNEEKVLQQKVKELESEAKTKKEEMELEINALTGEKQASIEKLMLEKEGIAQQLERSMLEVNDKEGQIEKVLREKKELEEGKVSQERQISELHEKIGELKDDVFTLKDLCANEEEKSKRLENEVMLERVIAQKGLEDEKKNGLSLKSKLSQMQKEIKENVQELGKIRNERQKLTEEKKKMKSSVESLTREKELVQKSLLEAKQHMDELRAKMESIGMNSDRALSMLKGTAAMVCQSKTDLDGKAEVVANESKFDSETEPYVADLEAIKNAFKNKEKLVEDMKRQVEYLQKFAAEERKQAIKKRRFWTVVSSAATLFAAAASIAYVTRVR